ncbi:WD40 repeat-like protein [Rhizopogon vinicolor AM-OR11-026]|uniref:WD40 repeat-like protein n=1 Tax=Rhizopogon vinicolor AM-OR11-026 TaxID=1314800 RepID=A0A1B7N5P5_9AGAM|nr:WD40 repeat-like protein [Rhizopogon vinicolor AM-OR11-026]
MSPGPGSHDKRDRQSPPVESSGARKRIRTERMKSDTRPEPPSSSSALMPINNTQISGGQFPDDLDPHNVPPELKKEGSDWFAVFSPKVKRVLDVSLMHTLMHESVVCCVRFSADGKYLATGCNRTTQIYDVKTGVKTCVLVDESASRAGDLYIRSVCFSPDGNFLATAAEDKQIRIWDIAKKRIRNAFDGHRQEIYSLDFSSDGRLIVSGSGDATVRIWDMVDGSSKVLTNNDVDPVNNDGGITSVAISPNRRLVAAGSLDTFVRIWDVATGMLIERLRGHRDSVYSVAFMPDGKGLISGSLDKTLKYWDISSLVASKNLAANSQCTMNFQGHTDYVLSVTASHDGQWIVSGSKDRSVQFWDSRTGTMQCVLQGHKNSVIAVDLSPAGGILATGSGDWQARIWSYTNMQDAHRPGSYTNLTYGGINHSSTDPLSDVGRPLSRPDDSQEPFAQSVAPEAALQDLMKYLRF